MALAMSVYVICGGLTNSQNIKCLLVVFKSKRIFVNTGKLYSILNEKIQILYKPQIQIKHVYKSFSNKILLFTFIM